MYTCITFFSFSCLCVSASIHLVFLLNRKFVSYVEFFVVFFLCFLKFQFMTISVFIDSFLWRFKWINFQSLRSSCERSHIAWATTSLPKSSSLSSPTSSSGKTCVWMFWSNLFWAESHLNAKKQGWQTELAKQRKNYRKLMLVFGGGCLIKEYTWQRSRWWTKRCRYTQCRRKRRERWCCVCPTSSASHCLLGSSQLYSWRGDDWLSASWGRYFEKQIPFIFLNTILLLIMMTLFLLLDKTLDHYLPWQWLPWKIWLYKH